MFSLLVLLCLPSQQSCAARLARLQHVVVCDVLGQPMSHYHYLRQGAGIRPMQFELIPMHPMHPMHPNASSKFHTLGCLRHIDRHGKNDTVITAVSACFCHAVNNNTCSNYRSSIAAGGSTIHTSHPCSWLRLHQSRQSCQRHQPLQFRLCQLWQKD